LFEETSSSESDSSDNEDDNLLLHASAALIDRRSIPKIGFMNVDKIKVRNKCTLYQ
jgi:hypothetical protein